MTEETNLEQTAEATSNTDASVQQTAEPTATAAESEGHAAPEDGKATQATQAPEKYEWKQPEGATIDEEVLGRFSEVARELNLSQEAAQKVLDQMAPSIAARQEAQLLAAREEWAASAKADKEFGGDKLPENLAVAKKALDAFASPEFRDLLEKTGLGNHPEVIRVLYRAGKAISADGFVSGQTDKTANDARRFYPNSNMK